MAMEMAYANLSTWWECAEPVGNVALWLMDLGPRSATAFYNPLHTPNTHKAHYTWAQITQHNKAHFKLLKVLTSTD